MKKLNAYFLMLLMSIGIFTACKDDENGGEPVFERPEISVPTSGLAVQIGQSTSFSVPVSAEGEIASVEVSSDQGTATISNETELIGETSGTATISFQAPETAGNAVITITVTDNQVEAKSETETFTVQITEEPQAEVVEIFTSAGGIGTTTWTKDKIYVLRGFAFVNEGQTLTIEEGTIIKGQPGTGAGASALIVARGGKIMAEGTAEEPIIFTALEDEIQPGETKSTLPVTSRGLWGGVILLGNAKVTTASGNANIEGIPVSETRGVYGGDNDDDNSGVMRYVSIRHGGTEIGEGNEINGLTMAGVGRGTTIEYIEAISNKDDGFEWFGGTVNTKYLVSAYNADEGMDYDQGWTGNNQFWFVYQDEEGDKGGEHDGGSSDCETCEPYSIPVIVNATYKGSESNTLLVYQDNAGGKYYNSIFVDYAEGVQVEDIDGEDSYSRLQNGDLQLMNNIFFNVAGDDATQYIVLSTGANEGMDISGEANFADNLTRDPQFNSLFIPAGDVSGATTVDGGFFESIDYIGAFDPSASAPWHAGWTEWSQIVQ
jgi:predicted secreted protein